MASTQHRHEPEVGQPDVGGHRLAGRSRAGALAIAVARRDVVVEELLALVLDAVREGLRHRLGRVVRLGLLHLDGLEAWRRRDYLRQRWLFALHQARHGLHIASRSDRLVASCLALRLLLLLGGLALLLRVQILFRQIIQRRRVARHLQQSSRIKQRTERTSKRCIL